MDYRYIREEDLPVVVTVTMAELEMLRDILANAIATANGEAAPHEVGKWRTMDLRDSIVAIHAKACERGAESLSAKIAKA
jgi:hypothetical protein